MCDFLAAAAPFPEKPITVIVPFAAGGGSDTFVRIFLKAIREHDLAPQSFVVKNIGGAGGTIGSRAALSKAGWLHDSLSTRRDVHGSTLRQRRLGPADFTPIAATGRSGVVVAVADNSPYKDLAELMADAVARPYQLVYGTNLGAPNHYSALFLQTANQGPNSDLHKRAAEPSDWPSSRVATWT